VTSCLQMMRKNTFSLKSQVSITLLLLFTTLKTCSNLSCKMVKNQILRQIRNLKELVWNLKRSNRSATDLGTTFLVPIFMWCTKKQLSEAHISAIIKRDLTQLSTAVITSLIILTKIKTSLSASNHSSLKIRNTTICSS
jgi:hypothetical protein